MKLSVIIPVYNKKRYLATLFEQLSTQTFRDYECLIIDDGSTDGSGAVCDEFAAKDARFRVFHIPNGGVSRARNLGLDNARGDYITFIDSDDQILPEYLENLYCCAEESGADMVIGNLEKFWEDDPRCVPLDIPYQGVYSLSDLLPDFARIQQSIGIYGFCTAKLLRRELLEGIRFDPSIRLAEDLSLYMDVYPRVHKPYFDRKPLYRYLQAAENSSMLDEASKIDYYTQLTIQLKIMRFLQSQDALTGENRTIMVNRIYDYVYFCLFYPKLTEITGVCCRLRELQLPAYKPAPSQPILRSAVLTCFARGWDFLIPILIGIYRTLRAIKRIIR